MEVIDFMKSKKSIKVTAIAATAVLATTAIGFGSYLYVQNVLGGFDFGGTEDKPSTSFLLEKDFSKSLIEGGTHDGLHYLDDAVTATDTRLLKQTLSWSLKTEAPESISGNFIDYFDIYDEKNPISETSPYLYSQNAKKSLFTRETPVNVDADGDSVTDGLEMNYYFTPNAGSKLYGEIDMDTGIKATFVKDATANGKTTRTLSFQYCFEGAEGSTHTLPLLATNFSFGATDGYNLKSVVPVYGDDHSENYYQTGLPRLKVTLEKDGAEDKVQYVNTVTLTEANGGLLRTEALKDVLVSETLNLTSFFPMTYIGPETIDAKSAYEAFDLKVSLALTA